MTLLFVLSEITPCLAAANPKTNSYGYVETIIAVISS